MTKQWKLSKCLWQQNLVHVYASKLKQTIDAVV